MLELGLLISLFIPFHLLYGRKKKWNNRNLKKTLFISMIILGTIGFYFSKTNDFRMFFYGTLCTPVFLFVNYVFKRLSHKLHKRDFYLWLRYSDEIDDSFSGIGTNTHVKSSDMCFSITLLILIIGLGVLGAILFGKDDLYSKFFEN